MIKNKSEPSILILVPAYDCAPTVAKVIKGAQKYGPVLLLDDGSRDKTALEAEKTGAFILKHKVNQGQGRATLSAAKYALENGYDYIVSIDADGQHDTDDIPAFIARIKELTAPTLLLGKRDMSEAPPIRSFGRDFSNFWFWVETGKKVSDLQSGFRAYPAKELLEAGCFWPRYEFMGEVLARFAWKGWAIESVDVKCYYPPAEERITHFRMVADNIRFVYMNTHMVTLRILNLLFGPSEKGASLVTHTSAKATMLGCLFFEYTYRIFGRALAYKFLYFVVPFYVLFARKAFAASRSYFEKIYGKLTWLEANKHFARQYMAMARTILDRVILLRAGSGAFSYEYDDNGERENLYEAEEGAIMLSAHFGNWDFVSGLAQDKKISVAMVMYQDKADQMGTYLRNARKDHPVEVIEVNEEEFTSLKILRHLRSGGALAIHGDRVWGTRTLSHDFLGAKAAFPEGPFLLSAVCRVPVFLCLVMKKSDDCYHMIMRRNRELEEAQGLTRQQKVEAWHAWYVSVIEEYARKYPHQWYNFYDFWAD